MTSAICTLFENHFHNGVAALINSLYKEGFRGDFYAGFKGTLPKWAEEAYENDRLLWPGARTLAVAEHLNVHFLPAITDFHLAHYKPDFMLALLNGPAKNADALAYFDPDIINLCRWGFYEKWMACGVAMVHEIVSNDMPATHPSRMEWQKIINAINRTPKRDLHSYINSGFCGVSRRNVEFLYLWSEIVQVAILEYKMDPKIFLNFDRTSAFYSIDQDAFNIAAMCCVCPVSEMGPEAMDFVGAGWTMSHSTGWPKPWRKKFILSALAGIPPSRQDKRYWQNIDFPISLFDSLKKRHINMNIIIGTMIGRFYRRT
ncbi:MAG: hypothetical protein JWQ28_3250 [Pedobacter sp.]|jgi:hypothetical protein|nr:hypothetical protein [Pedobacter sp.]